VDGKNFELLMKETRQMLDRIGKEYERYYELTLAIGVGPDKLENWAKSAKMSEMM